MIFFPHMQVKHRLFAAKVVYQTQKVVNLLGKMYFLDYIVLKLSII